MDLLYVTEFSIAARGHGDAFLSTLGHVASWLNRNQPGAVKVDDLLSDGTAALAPAEVLGQTVDDRVATWETIRGSDATAVRVSVVQQVASGLEVATRITVISDEHGTFLRIGLSRDLPGGALAPVRETAVFQPALLGVIARDESLVLRSAGQLVDGRYLPVRNTEHLTALREAVLSANRLPILLVHVRTPISWDTARIASSKLIGLVRVITINNVTRLAIADAIPNTRVPFGGAALVWSDVAASALLFGPEALKSLGAEGVRAELMRRIAPLSALARGVDTHWRRVRTDKQRQELDAISRQAGEARSRSDAPAELVALRETVATLLKRLEDAEEVVEEYSRESAELRSKAESADVAEGQATYWREQYMSLAGGPEEPEADIDPWESVPPLLSGADPADTFLALTDASEQRIVFTDDAAKSWSKINYPEPADMATKLGTLARAAWQLYAGDPITMGHVDDWFKLNYGLNVALSDDTIEKSKALRSFDHEGKTYSQVPHVKVRDGVKPNQVGRIHFAFDAKGERLIVNHVALKLYGV